MYNHHLGISCLSAAPARLTFCLFLQKVLSALFLAIIRFTAFQKEIGTYKKAFGWQVFAFALAKMRIFACQTCLFFKVCALILGKAAPVAQTEYGFN